MYTRGLRAANLLIPLATSIALAGPADGQEHRHGSPPDLSVPESIRVEHEAIHERLVRATGASGPVGAAARKLAETLHPHFVREEEIALPPLSLLEPLARGTFSSEMRSVLPLTDALRAELPRMLEEHRSIADAARALERTAREEGDAGVEALAKELQLHARSEEEVFYPAAILVGDLVRLRLP